MWLQMCQNSWTMHVFDGKNWISIFLISPFSGIAGRDNQKGATCGERSGHSFSTMSAVCLSKISNNFSEKKICKIWQKKNPWGQGRQSAATVNWTNTLWQLEVCVHTKFIQKWCGIQSMTNTFFRVGSEAFGENCQKKKKKKKNNFSMLTLWSIFGVSHTRMHAAKHIVLLRALFWIWSKRRGTLTPWFYI